MCPDKLFLSEYYDGELASPYKEKLEAHIASCDSCKAVLSSFGGLSAALKTADANESAGFANAGERVWTRIESERAWRRHSRAGAFLSKKITVPLPAAIAAAALVLLFAALIVRTGGRQNIPDTSFVADAVVYPDEIQQISSMGDALRYIENDDFFSGVSGNYVIMRMPENRTFYNYGNPQIRNASTMPARAVTAP